ncbi:MAG TPA: TraR/DksA family transcriptional regulator [Actinomycetota bacterium]|nr:TraR/DksA family transcriptional regulator [Actinomycetota bacterium]
MNDEARDALRAALVARRDELRAALTVITDVPVDPVAPVSFGKRVGDGTTEAVERLTKVGTARELDASLADVDRALEKLDDGTYGTCDVCGDAIAPARLEARPWSVRCVRCASAAVPR